VCAITDIHICIVQSIQDLEKQRDTGIRANETVTFKNNKQQQQLRKEGKLNHELNNRLVKASTKIEALVGDDFDLPEFFATKLPCHLWPVSAGKSAQGPGNQVARKSS